MPRLNLSASSRISLTFLWGRVPNHSAYFDIVLASCSCRVYLNLIIPNVAHILLVLVVFGNLNILFRCFSNAVLSSFILSYHQRMCWYHLLALISRKHSIVGEVLRCWNTCVSASYSFWSTCLFFLQLHVLAWAGYFVTNKYSKVFVFFNNWEFYSTSKRTPSTCIWKKGMTFNLGFIDIIHSYMSIIKGPKKGLIRSLSLTYFFNF